MSCLFTPPLPRRRRGSRGRSLLGSRRRWDGAYPRWNPRSHPRRRPLRHEGNRHANEEQGHKDTPSRGLHRKRLRHFIASGCAHAGSMLFPSGVYRCPRRCCSRRINFPTIVAYRFNLGKRALGKQEQFFILLQLRTETQSPLSVNCAAASRQHSSNFGPGNRSVVRRDAADPNARIDGVFIADRTVGIRRSVVYGKKLESFICLIEEPVDGSKSIPFRFLIDTKSSCLSREFMV